MQSVYSWLLSIVAAGMICAISAALVRGGMPEGVTRFTGGLLLLLAVALPLAKLDLSALFERLDAQWSARDFEAEEYEARAQKLLQEQVADVTQRLVLAQASSLGMEVEVCVTVSTEGLPQPLTVELFGEATPAQRTALSAYLSDAIGIPPSRQKWRTS